MFNINLNEPKTTGQNLITAIIGLILQITMLKTSKTKHLNNRLTTNRLVRIRLGHININLIGITAKNAPRL